MQVRDNYKIDTQHVAVGALLRHGDELHHFDAFIEATGQRPLGVDDFPFPSLRKQGVVRNVASEENEASRGIAIDEQFHFIADDLPTSRLFCLSLPFILGRHPFIQGITSSHQMGSVVGEELAAALNYGECHGMACEVLGETA